MLDKAKMRAMLSKHEGRKNKVYYDSVGIATIGVGRNLEGKGLSEPEIDFLLDNDIDDATTEAKTFYWWHDLDSVRQMVVVDMVFNLGLDGFSEFKKTIGFIVDENYGAASVEMLDSDWATQVGHRANELSDMMRDGSIAI
jgi:lysozyme